MSDSQCQIKEIIVHILDNSMGMPILSDKVHPDNDEIMILLINIS
ncbi:hypothetical protein N752_23320 [Desulforamulus aquiferis]|nr:hypothetical protein N752_23320 [Desulforamulus aquiferis]